MDDFAFHFCGFSELWHSPMKGCESISCVSIHDTEVYTVHLFLASEMGSKLAVIITDEILGSLSIRSRLPQLLCGPSVGRKSCHPDMHDLPRGQFDEEKRKERAKEEIGDLQEIAGPESSSVMLEEGRPLLPTWREIGDLASCISELFVYTHEYQA